MFNLNILSSKRSCLHFFMCLFFSLGSQQAFSQTGIFSFSDYEGFKKCLSNDYLIERLDDKSVSQTRYLGKADIALRCVETSNKILRNEKQVSTFKKYIDLTIAKAGWGAALDMVAMLVGRDRKSCNGMSQYELLLKALGQPKFYPSKENSYFKKAGLIISKCISDKTFKSDILEEQQNSDAYVRKNVCSWLKTLKKVKTCQAYK